MIGGRRIECELYLLPALARTGFPRLLRGRGVRHCFAQQPLDPAAGVLEFGEDQQAAFRPGRPAITEPWHHLAADPVDQPLDQGIGRGAVGIGEGAHLADRGDDMYDRPRVGWSLVSTSFKLRTP